MIAREPTLVLARRVRAFAPVAAAADALIVNNGRIAEVGTADALRARYRAARTIDLRPATLTPGFTDAHIHLVEWAFARLAVDLSDSSGPEHAARSIAAAPPTGAGLRWLRGRGWNPHRWNGETPHRSILDAVVDDGSPVVLQSHDMHALWVNSAALRAAGIDAGTADPTGGRIERDADGQPTGVLYDYACPLVIDAMPAPPRHDVLRALEAAQAALHEAGFTGVHSFPGIHIPQPDPLDLLRDLHARGRLRMRVLQHIRSDHVDAAAALGMRSGSGDDWIRVGAAKFFLDGALGSRTAWMRAPYEGSGDCGIRVLQPAEFRDAVHHAASAGFASTVHAIGDAAVALAIDVLTDADTPRLALPHRIEHVQCLPADRVDRLHRVICSVQPAHLITDWPAVDRHWGDRAVDSYAFGSMLGAGAILAFGSDAPVEPIDPRRALYAAVLRQDPALPGAGWQPQQRISRGAALRGYIEGPATAAGIEDRFGRLAAGYAADIAAWDDDPFACADEALLDLTCVATMVGGELVHSVLEEV